MVWKSMAEVKLGDRFVLTQGDAFPGYVLIAVHENGDWTVRKQDAQTDQDDELWKSEDFVEYELYWVE